MSFFRDIIVRHIIIPVTLVFFAPLASFSATGVKTSFKKYSLFTYEGRVYLCEPYLVQKDEWLYKIFRQKGEISAADFPLFLKIFKSVNPQIANIDAISPGKQILIPLQQVDKDDYEQDNNGTVEVPVLAFSTLITPPNVSGHTHTHKVKSGDTISELLSKEFLTSRGNVSPVGEKAVLHLNPNMRDINCIYLGESITIPDPSILSQPWFNNFIGMGNAASPRTESTPGKKTPPSPEPKPISMVQLGHLKRYTQLINGRLMHQGKLFFPSVNPGQNPQSIDLSKTPVISDGTGKKTLLLEPDATEASMAPDLVAAMKAYWQDLQFKKINEILNTQIPLSPQTMTDRPGSQESLIRILMAATSYSYEPQVSLPVSFNDVKITVMLGRITHEQDVDILINSGSVYGKALDMLKNQGYRILNLPLDLSFEAICTRLFSQLRYQVWKDPSFNIDRKVYSIPGLYIEKEPQKLFLTRSPLFKEATTFLENENIDVIILD